MCVCIIRVQSRPYDNSNIIYHVHALLYAAATKYTFPDDTTRALSSLFARGVYLPLILTFLTHQNLSAVSLRRRGVHI